MCFRAELCPKGISSVVYVCVYVLYVHPGGKEKSQSPPLLGAFAQEEGRPCVALFIKLFLASAIDRARCCAPSRHIQRGE